MAYQLEYSVQSYTPSLNAKLFDSSGQQVGSTITTGFVSLGNTWYSYLATHPDGHVGTFVIYDSANPTAAQSWTVQPKETELPSASTIATAILDTAITEPTSVFSWSSATVRKILQWLAVLNRNKMTVTSTTQVVRNDADNATIATSTVSDDGTTGVNGAWQ